MKEHKLIRLILPVILLSALIAAPARSATSKGTNFIRHDTSLPDTLQGISGATAEWWEAVQEQFGQHPGHAAWQSAGIIDLSLIPDWTGESNTAEAYFGMSVGTAGDVNGDGYDDVIVGAPYYTNGQEHEGAVAVYHGSSSGLYLLPNWIYERNDPDVHFGNSVGTAGDVNGDGYDDVIIGEFLFGDQDQGLALVFHGSPSGLKLVSDWYVLGGQSYAQLGSSVGTAGDVNGDGFDDVIVGVPGYDSGEQDEGVARVYFGSESGLSLVSNWMAEGNLLLARFGSAVGTAGDVNGDGFDDVIIGADGYRNGHWSEGAAFVYHGSASGVSLFIGWKVEGNQEEAQLGHSVGTAGDVNGDGYADIIVGAPGYTNAQIHEGAAAVYHGSSSGLDFLPNWTGESNQEVSGFGSSVGTAGDVNGDGFADVIVGAASYDKGEEREGAAVVYYGSASGLDLLPSWWGESNQAQALFGWSAGTAGDVNGDDYDDVIVGAPYYDYGQLDEGVAAVYHGDKDYFHIYLPLSLNNP